MIVCSPGPSPSGSPQRLDRKMAVHEKQAVGIQSRQVEVGSRGLDPATIRDQESTFTGAAIYEYDRNTAPARTTVQPRNRIFFVHGRTLSAYGPSASGYQLAWSFEARGNILAAPVVRGGAVYIGDDKGNLYRLEAND